MKLDQFHDGEWIEPVGPRFIVKCCRCGLRHRMEFRVRQGRVQFRAYRLDAKGRTAKERGMAKKWIQASGVSKNKGGLHRALHVPEGEPIPPYKLAEALHSKNQHTRKMAGFAKSMKSIKRKKK